MGLILRSYPQKWGQNCRKRQFFTSKKMGSAGRIRTYNLVLTPCPNVSKRGGLSHHPLSFRYTKVKVKKKYNFFEPKGMRGAISL